MLPGLLVISLVVIIGSYGLSLFHVWRRRFPPLPPGPWRKPIIGNLLDLPNPDEQDWQNWLRHKELFGENMKEYCDKSRRLKSSY